METRANAPMVSVAIATYNQRAFIEACLASVLTQDFPDFEVVVADDGSTDGTRELLQDLERRHPDRLRLDLADRNEGITPNCNRLFRACRGRYIAWIGGDDLMLPGKLRKQVELMERDPGCVICYHDLDVFDSETGRTIRHFNDPLAGIRPREGGAETWIRFGTFGGACSIMTRRSACPASGFDARIPVSSDWLFWIETAMHGTTRFIPEVLGRYRRHAGNVTLQPGHGIEERLETLAIVDARYPQFSKHTRAFRAWFFLDLAADRGRPGAEARAFLLRSLRLGWVSWKWLGWYLQTWTRA